MGDLGKSGRCFRRRRCSLCGARRCKKRSRRTIQLIAAHWGRSAQAATTVTEGVGEAEPEAVTAAEAKTGTDGRGVASVLTATAADADEASGEEMDKVRGVMTTMTAAADVDRVGTGEEGVGEAG